MPIIKIDSTTSTNLYLKELLDKEELPEGTVVITQEQTAGRGQKGTYWESEPGSNLTFSLLLRPSFLPIDRHFLLSKVIALGITDSLGNGYTIKWPNDIYYKDKKLVGILIENQITGSIISQSVIGIGINVNQTHFRSNAPNPISMRNITGEEYSLDELLLAIIQAIDARYRRLKAENYEQIEHDYYSRLYRKDGIHPFSDKNGAFNASIQLVDNAGYMHLLTEADEIRKYAFKEVVFLTKS